MKVIVSKSYCFHPVKIVRDLVHEYVNLTKFDLDILDTIPFQRLKDISQLTCQHVYPAARHTRFDHSLGVLELTRQAIKHLNKNGIVGSNPKENSEPIITDSLEFNAVIAALLHDVGHCPFSHMGETEFDPEYVREYLYNKIMEHPCSTDCENLLEKINVKSAKNIGSVHEQLSCIVILEHFTHILTNLTSISSDYSDTINIEIDFELIMRSILGIEYDVSSHILFEQNKVKNVIVRLVNSSIFDMDKLDYIMRDSFFTGIGTPLIDTKRLFRNMYFNDKLSIVFTSKAVPALQNMIDSRDGLYMYVYNHHAVVFSDFMYTYISRRWAHNAEAFLQMVYPNMTDKAYRDAVDILHISSLGLIPKPYLFSVEAILEQNRSDSDWRSLLNVVYTNCPKNDTHPDGDDSVLLLQVRGALEEIWDENFGIFEYDKNEALNIESESGKGDNKELTEEMPDFSESDIKFLANKVNNAFDLVSQFMTRHFLKPWWKTVFEFNSFMNHYFRDDIVRKQVCKFICDGGNLGLEAAEFRSQIAKHVIYITQKLIESGNSELVEELKDGDFFVIQRSTRFFSPNTIEKLEIALKSSEIIGSPINTEKINNNNSLQEYYVKMLTNIIPQKDYSSIYSKEGFYIFSKPLSAKYDADIQKKNRHYRLLERILAFVAIEFIRRGEQDFTRLFHPDVSSENKGKTKLELKRMVQQAEVVSFNAMYEAFQSVLR